jgi:DNA-binding beta-propeller fold protein YncE
MPFLPVAPPVPAPIVGGFDYVTVDAQRRRVYAAHTGSNALLIVDADSGSVVGQVRVGPLHGVAVDPANGHVYTGDGTARTVSEVDPVAKKVLRSAAVDGSVDAIAYDPSNGRIYADENNGTRIFVVDAITMKTIATVQLPGHKPEYLAVDPATHEVYQNIADVGEFVVIDAASLTVKRTVPTPELTSNHPLQYDPVLKHVLVGGVNGVLSAYDADGKLLSKTTVQPRIDQCDLDAGTHTLACAGNAQVTVLRDGPSGMLTVVAQSPVPPGVHTLAIDAKTGRVWIVWASQDPAAPGDLVQAFTVTP